MLDYAQHCVLLCCNHATYCLFELASRAEQENLLRLKISFPSRVMPISFILSVVSSIEQVQEMELSNEEITEADNMHNCILWRSFLLSLLF